MFDQGQGQGHGGLRNFSPFTTILYSVSCTSYTSNSALANGRKLILRMYSYGHLIKVYKEYEYLNALIILRIPRQFLRLKERTLYLS